MNIITTNSKEQFIKDINETLQNQINIRKEARKHIKYAKSSFPLSEKERAKRAAEWKPLPSDIIQDSEVWSDWKLDNTFTVIKA